MAEDDDRVDPDVRKPVLPEERAERDRMSDGLFHGVIEVPLVPVEHLGPLRLFRRAVDRAPIVLGFEGVHAPGTDENVIDLGTADDQIMDHEPVVREAIQYLRDPAFADGAEVEVVAAAYQNSSGDDEEAAKKREAGNREDDDHPDGNAEHATRSSCREGAREALLVLQDGGHSLF